jgi:hypothetical protein
MFGSRKRRRGRRSKGQDQILERLEEGVTALKQTLAEAAEVIDRVRAEADKKRGRRGWRRG